MASFPPDLISSCWGWGRGHAHVQLNAGDILTPQPVATRDIEFHSWRRLASYAFIKININWHLATCCFM